MQNLMLIMINHGDVSHRSLVPPPSSNWKYKKIKGNKNTKIDELRRRVLKRLHAVQSPPVKNPRYINSNLVNAAMQYACATAQFEPVANAILIVDIEGESISVSQSPSRISEISEPAQLAA